MITVDIFFRKEQNWRKWSKKYLRRITNENCCNWKRRSRENYDICSISTAVCRRREKVFAVDVDPDADKSNTFYKVNPRVDDIPETYGKENNGVRLLVLGTVETAGGGCVCPENVMLKRIINNLVLHRDDIVILDMEAGLEHLGRGTTEGMDQFIVVIEPGARSVQTYKNVKRLAEELGVKEVKVIANKIRNDEDEKFVRSRIPKQDFLGCVHYNAEVIEADREGRSPYGCSKTATDEIREIKEIFDVMAK